MEFSIDKTAKKCYEPRDPPIILSCGRVLSPFTLNSAKLLEDEEKYTRYKMDPLEMRNHALERYEASIPFRKAINYSITFLKNNGIDNYDIISGGRTEDWPFAAAIATKLKKDFLALYKPRDNESPKLINPRGEVKEAKKEIVGEDVFHVSSSITHERNMVRENGGWIKQIREMSANVDSVMVLINGNYDNKRKIKNKWVEFMPLINIDSSWIRENDPTNKHSLEFIESNPLEWTISYLSNLDDHKVISRYFDVENNGKKDNRHLTFLKTHRPLLEGRGLWDKIEEDCREHGINLEERLKDINV